MDAEIDVEVIVARAFETTFDGTPERIRVVGDRARNLVNHAIIDNRIGWFAARRLRRRAEAEILRQVAALGPL